MAACGYVGDPLPPSLNIPVAINDLRLEQVGDRLLITFTAPEMTTDGVRLARLGGAEVTVNGQAAPAAVSAPGVVKLEVPAAPLAGQEVTVAARVASPKGRFSEWANASIAVLAPLPVPDKVTAEATAEGVRLRWQGAKASYRILRRLGAVESEIATVTTNEYLDREAAFGETYRYRVEAFSGAARSGFSAVVEITPEDRFPPAAPAGLTAVAGIGSIELAWEPGTEADIAGYQVYRAEGAGEWRPVGAQSLQASYSDREVKSGARYRYTVVAIDRKGNESARPAVVEMVAP
jgi:fibronectin type 3 domain-containing protein